MGSIKMKAHQLLQSSPPLCYHCRQSNMISTSWCLSHMTFRHHAISDAAGVFHGPPQTICYLCASGFHNVWDGCCAYANACHCVWTCVCHHGSLFYHCWHYLCWDTPRQNVPAFCTGGIWLSWQGSLPCLWGYLCHICSISPSACALIFWEKLFLLRWWWWYSSVPISLYRWHPLSHDYRSSWWLGWWWAHPLCLRSCESGLHGSSKAVKEHIIVDLAWKPAFPLGNLLGE